MTRCAAVAQLARLPALPTILGCRSTVIFSKTTCLDASAAQLRQESFSLLGQVLKSLGGSGVLHHGRLPQVNANYGAAASGRALTSCLHDVLQLLVPHRLGCLQAPDNRGMGSIQRIHTTLGLVTLQGMSFKD